MFNLLLGMLCDKPYDEDIADDVNGLYSELMELYDELPPLLNNSNDGGDWREHGVTKDQVYGRQSKTRLGSEILFQEVVDKIIKEHIKKGNIKED